MLSTMFAKLFFNLKLKIMVKLKLIIREESLVLRISEGKVRFYKSVKHILKGDPNIKKHWNADKEKFSAYAVNAKENNEALEEFKGLYQELVNAHPQLSARQISSYYDRNTISKAKSGVSSIDTIYNFIDIVVAREKEKPGCNFEIYDKLKRKCERLIPFFKSMTFESLNFDECITIAKIFAKNSGYRGTTKAFRALLGKADKDKSVKFSLSQIGDFKFSDYSQKNNEVYEKKPDVLSSRTLKAFLNLDLNNCTPKYSRKEVEVFHDFCVFMFNSMLAPCDIVNLQYRHITRDNMIVKKREKTHVQVDVPVTPAMETIIRKYMRRTTDGYVFPIMNDKLNAQGNVRNSILKKFRKDLNVWLKCVGDEIGAEFNLYAYVFRHTAITVALDNGLPIAYVAMVAGTSIEMIQKHYYNGDNQTNRSKLQFAFTMASMG